MAGDNYQRSFSNLVQLEHIKDLTGIYKTEKEKRKELEAANQELMKYADDLNKTTSELNVARQELQEARIDIIYRLVLAAEYKDEDTGDHIVRMSHYSALIAEKLGLEAKDVKNIFYAAPMHDIGKIGIPDDILVKPGKLTDEEFNIMKTHTTIGAQILANSKSEILNVAEQIALSHHEKWNGKGYPQGLSGDKIPLVGRIASIADVFDALTSSRPYKEPYPAEVAFEIIKKERGQHFDPDVADVFLENIDQVLQTRASMDSVSESFPYLMSFEVVNTKSEGYKLKKIPPVPLLQKKEGAMKFPSVKGNLIIPDHVLY